MTQRWRTVRVFIDSTFRDMHAERDHLVGVVFPELRERLEPYRIHFREVELRWGVTQEQAENGNALDIVLDQIDECRPFYVCLLGERYGWVPDEATLSAVRERRSGRSVLPGKSVTELGIRYAVLNLPQPELMRALFFFRDPSFIADVPCSIRPSVEAESPVAAEKMSQLKDAIRTAPLLYAPVENYPCRYAGLRVDWPLLRSTLSQLERDTLEPIAGDGLIDNSEYSRLDEALRRAVDRHSVVYLAGLEEFGRQVRDRLWTAIREELELPVTVPGPAVEDELAQESDFHERFMESHLTVYCGREALQLDLQQFAGDDEIALLLLTGQPGVGRSAALARFVTQYRIANPNVLVIPHFVGASPTSNSLRYTLRRLCWIVEQQAGQVTPPPKDLAHLVPRFRACLRDAPPDHRIVVVLDGIERLVETASFPGLNWLPWTLPAHVRVIIGCPTEPGPAELLLAAARERPHREIEVHYLSDDEWLIAAREILALSGKSLDQSDWKLLLSNPAARNPLFLHVVLEELRSFGNFEQLKQRISLFPRRENPLTALFDQVLERLEATFGQAVVAGTVSLLASARRGLSERELLDLIDGPDTTASTTESLLFPLLRQLRPYLRQRGRTWDFFHRSLFLAARQRYLGTPERQQEGHRRLAQYFRNLPANDARRLDELPWQLVQSGEWLEAGQLITDITTMEARFHQNAIREFFDDCEFILRSQPAGVDVEQQLISQYLIFAGAYAELLRDEKLAEDEPDLVAVLAFNSADSGPLVQQAESVLRGRLGSLPRVATRRPTYSPDEPRKLSHHCSGAAVVGLHVRGECEIVSIVLDDGRIRHWHVRSGEMIDSVADSDRFRRSALTASGERLIVLTENSTAKVWSTDTGDLLDETVLPNAALDVALSPDEKHCFITLEGSGLCCCAVGSNGLLSPPRSWASLPVATTLATSPSGSSLACGGRDGTLTLWDIAHAERHLHFPAHTSAVRSLAFHPSGTSLVTAGNDWVLKHWSRAAGEQLAAFQGHSSQATAVAISPDGQYMASAGGWDQTILVWDLNSSKCVASHRTSSFEVTRLVISVDGRWLVSGGSDGRVEIWDMRIFVGRS